MMTNRSMLPSTVIPELAYPDVREAADWLCRAFGFVERLRIANHRVQLTFGDGSIVVTEQRGEEGAAPTAASDHSVMVRVADVDEHYERAKQSNARIISPPSDYPFGERQYTVDDFAGHRWTFSQTIADADPKDWGGTLVK